MAAINKENKRGFLLAEETLKIIIAVICVIFLVYLLAALYNSHSSDKKLNQAKDILTGTDEDSRSIEGIILSLKEGGNEIKDISDPSGWHLYSFVGQEKPNSCLNQRCLCICQKSFIERINSQAEKCDDDGVCLVVPNLAASEIDLKIGQGKKALFLEIKKQNGKVFIEEKI